MRRTRFLPALAVLVLSACNEQMIYSPETEGELVINLKAEERVKPAGVTPGTRAGSVLPDVNDFWIELVNSENVKFKREKYADLSGKSIGMNAGEFTMMAKHGDTLGVGFDKPFYMAKKSFEVLPQEKVVVNAVAKLANVMLAVNYGDQIRQDYSGFYTVVTNMDHSRKSLKFLSTETRNGYIPGGRLGVVVYATVEGVQKCYTLKDPATGEPIYIDALPNDFITLHVDTGISYGALAVSIKIDNEIEIVNLEPVEIPADAVSNTKPSIVCSSVDADGTYYVTEGIQSAPADLGFTYKAYAGIKKCELAVTSDYLKSLGVPEKIDIMNMDQSLRNSLESIGFFLAETANVGVVGFEDIIYEYSRTARYMGGGEPTQCAVLTLSIADNMDNTASKTIKVLTRPDGAASISWNDYDVWATKVVNPVVTVDKGNVSLMKVQSSLDGNSWSDFRNVTSAYYQMGAITGLEPSTKYYLRVTYDDWMVISDVFSLTTEAAQQVGNAGFEEFQCVDFLYTPQGGSQRGEPWYLPWNDASTAWWDVNSKRTLRTSPTLAYQNYKCYPTVSYIDSGTHGGGKSAQIASVATGHGASELASGTSYPGELFIGKSNDKHQDDWAYASTGHSFSSRPSKVSFWYQFEAYDGESFYVGAEVRDASGNVIAKAEKTSSAGVSAWTEMTLDFNYSNTTTKAAAVFMTFKSSTESHPAVQKRKLTYYNSDSDNHYVGTVLRVDDVQMLY